MGVLCRRLLRARGAGRGAGSTEHAILRLAPVAHGAVSSRNCQLQTLPLWKIKKRKGSLLRSLLAVTLLCCIQLFLQLFFVPQLMCQALCLLVKGRCCIWVQKFPSFHCKENIIPLTSRSWAGSLPLLLPTTVRKVGSLILSLSTQSVYQPSASFTPKTKTSA